jgi:hypothetical protein
MGLTLFLAGGSVSARLADNGTKFYGETFRFVLLYLVTVSDVTATL